MTKNENKDEKGTKQAHRIKYEFPPADSVWTFKCFLRDPKEMFLNLHEVNL
jgi:hypothetical protein